MRKFLFILLFLSSNALACSTNMQNELLAFALELEAEDESNSESFSSFQILSSIQKEDMFLKGITAVVVNEFLVDLDILETGEYIGGYYTSYISVAKKHAKDLVLILDYKATTKNRNGFALCANGERFLLVELLQAPKAEKTPLPTSPPPPPGEIDV